MHALITRLRFKDEAGPEMEAAEARLQTEEMRAQDGFVAFYLVRIAPTEAIFVRIYDSREQLAAGFAHGFRPELGREFAERPERMAGEVVASG